MFNFKQKKGFTLVELMLVVAVIGILAGIVTVSLSGMRERGEDAKILAELSAVIQPILMCQSGGNEFYIPAGWGGANICREIGGVEIPAYGSWPVVQPRNYLSGLAGSWNTGTDWHFYVNGNLKRICCNSRSKQCASIPLAVDCINSTDLTQY